ncbi:hypothetical protein JCM11251_000896 [Rhodosporidiobolus azoricus]
MWARAQQFVEDTVAPYVSTAVTSVVAHVAPDLLPPIDPFPPLPFELVLRILSFTLPPLSYTHAHARAKRLKRLALLNKDTARWAVLELRTHVALSTVQAARWFVMTARKKGPAWAGAVRSLRLGNAEHIVGATAQRDSVDHMWRGAGTGQLVRDLLRVCNNVQELWVCGISGIEVEDLGEGKLLRKLYITDTRIVPSSTPSTPDLVLPHLHSLYLKSVIFTGPSLSILLSQVSLPALRTLDYLSVHQSLVSPLVHPRARPQAGPLLLGGGGGGGPAGGLASITASLAALSGPTTSTVSDSPSPLAQAPFDALAASYPILSLSAQLSHLSLGPYAQRTLPLSILTNGGLNLRFPSLRTLSIPCTIIEPELLDPASFPPGLRALRLTNDLLKDAYRDAPDMDPLEAEGERDSADLQRERAINVFRHQAMSVFSSSSGCGNDRATRILAVPRLDAHCRKALRDSQVVDTLGRNNEDGMHDIASFDTSFLPSSSGASSAAKKEPQPSHEVESSLSTAGSFPLLIVEEDQELLELWPRRDSAWELGAKEWRERVERGQKGWERELVSARTADVGEEGALL